MADLGSDTTGTHRKLDVTKMHRENGGEGDGRSPRDVCVCVCVEIGVLLTADVMPSKGLASLHRALATETAAGRRVVAVSGEPMRDQWLIDPQTYRIVGMRMVRGGKVVGGGSTVARAVVDEAGDCG